MSMRDWTRRLSSMLRRRQFEEELDEDVRMHLEMATAENIRRGMSPEDARSSARRSFGGIEQMKEVCRDTGGISFVEGMVQDLRYGFRQIQRSPRLAGLITLIFALGIGTNTTMFSLLRAASNLPVRDQASVVLLWSINQERALDRTPVSFGDFADMKVQLKSVSNLVGFLPGSVHLIGDAEPARLAAGRITDNFFEFLGTAPAIGRDFVADEFADSAERTVILAHSTWQAHFGADPLILDRYLRIDGTAHKVIGVMGPEFFFFLSPDIEVWLPQQEPGTSDDRTVRNLLALGRIQSPGDMEQVEAEVAILSSQLAADHPDTHTGWAFGTTGAIPVREGESVFIMLLLGGVFVLVLGIVCANVSNLLLARAIGRSQEIAVRLALGAGRLRVARMLLIETSVVVALGALVGLLVGVWGTDAARDLNASPFWRSAQVDSWVLSLSVGVAILCALLCGLTPMVRALRTNIVEATEQMGRGVTVDRRGHGLRRTLMVGQIAAATVLLILSGLLLRTATQLRAIEPGFRTEGILTFRTEMAGYRYATADEAAAAHLRILDELRAAPGIESAGAGTRVPTQGSRNNPTQPLLIEGREYMDAREQDWATDLSVTPGYFETLGIPLQYGRYFNTTDAATSPAVGVVSRSMADRYWDAGSAVGRRVRLADAGTDAPWITIVGVVGDVRNDDADAPPLPMLYLPLSQHPVRTLSYAVRTSGPGDAAAMAVRVSLESAEPGLPAYAIRTMEQLLDEDLFGTYLTASFTGILAAIALSLASIGVFGVISSVTAESRPEIAFRVALGASPNQILQMFLWRGVRPGLTGVAIGTAAALLAASLIRVSLYSVSFADPMTYSGAVGIILLVTVAAAYLPSRRAARLDPMTVLRSA